MSLRQEPHPILDDVAVYALGALPPSEARRVRAHIATCAVCAQEYARLKPAAGAIGLAAETTGDARECPSTLLKPRIMAKIRTEASDPQTSRGASGAQTVRSGSAPNAQAGRSASGAQAARRPMRQPVWPAYLVAAACLAFAIAISVWNVAVTGQLRQAQQEQAREQQHSQSLARALTDARTTLSDLLGSDAKHYVVRTGEVVARGSRLYVAMHDLPQPPHGHVYQVWTLPKGSKTMVPSSTFLPDAHGAAVIALTPDAHATAAVAVSVEPEGGSKHPTTAPIFVVPLT
jgi:anti-sigma-K factor RskA